MLHENDMENGGCELAASSRRRRATSSRAAWRKGARARGLPGRLLARLGGAGRQGARRAQSAARRRSSTVIAHGAEPSSARSNDTAGGARRAAADNPATAAPALPPPRLWWRGRGPDVRPAKDEPGSRASRPSPGPTSGGPGHGRRTAPDGVATSRRTITARAAARASTPRPQRLAAGRRVEADPDARPNRRSSRSDEEHGGVPREPPRREEHRTRQEPAGAPDVALRPRHPSRPRARHRPARRGATRGRRLGSCT